MADLVTPNPPNKPNLPESAPSRRAKMTIFLVVMGVIGLNAALFLRSCLSVPERVIEGTADLVVKAGKALSDVAAAFNQGTVTTEFISYASRLESQHYLQFATFEQTELFTRSEISTTAFGYIPLPEVVVEARAPVEFTYYLDLNAPWKFHYQEGVVHVFAPRIRFNTPAVDASAITYEVKKGVVKTAVAQENLKKSITSLVKLRAIENIHLIQEHGRRQTIKFVERWLSNSFSDGEQHAVKVYFPGETPPDNLTVDGGPLP